MMTCSASRCAWAPRSQSFRMPYRQKILAIENGMSSLARATVKLPRTGSENVGKLMITTLSILIMAFPHPESRSIAVPFLRVADSTNHCLGGFQPAREGGLFACLGQVCFASLEKSQQVPSVLHFRKR